MENNDQNLSHSIPISFNNDFSIDEGESILKYPNQEIDFTSDEKTAYVPMPGAISTQRNTVSGYYTMITEFGRTELRIDVDGNRPMQKVSGDFYNNDGGTTTYSASFRMNNPQVAVLSTLVRIEGFAKTTWDWPVNHRIRITIPRTLIGNPRAPATLTWSNAPSEPDAVYVCRFRSQYFRRVFHEMDFEEGTTPFVSYNTGTLPSGGPARVLSITSAYNEAGIDFPQIGGNQIMTTETQGDNRWTDVELHASMVRHFSLYQNLSQWVVWTIACRSPHVRSIAGIMFDLQGLHRQGCAVFYGLVDQDEENPLGGTTADRLRFLLYAHVHELGHCFNLLHSWEKSQADPPAEDRPASLSWMNYPWHHPDGEAVFWNTFPFQFDDLEVIHLRHAFRNDIILGGKNFSKGSALESTIGDIQLFDDPIEDKSGLQLRIESYKQFYDQGEPVVLDLKLSTIVKYDRLVHTSLNPKSGHVEIGILTPSRRFVKYKNLIDYLEIPETTILNDNNPAIYTSAYIGYGKDLYFDQIGEYSIRVIYYALDGSRVYSNILSINVIPALNRTDQQVANLLQQDQVGKSFALLGVSPVLPKANQAFDTILKEYSDSNLAVYVQFIKGITEGREFKLIEDGKINVLKEPSPKTSIPLLEKVVEKTKQNQRLDNITANFAMRKLSQQHLLNKDNKKAKQVMDDMVTFFSEKGLNVNVINTIKIQAKDALKQPKIK
jgi:hypothetical protein